MHKLFDVQSQETIGILRAIRMSLSASKAPVVMTLIGKTLLSLCSLRLVETSPSPDSMSRRIKTARKAFVYTERSSGGQVSFDSN